MYERRMTVVPHEKQPQQEHQAITDRIDKRFIDHKWAGPSLIGSAAIGAALVSIFLDRAYLARWEAFALMFAALMMLWSAWGSRAMAMSSREELRELQLQRYATLTPVLSMAWPLMAPDYKGVTHLILANVGLGPAMNLRISFNGESAASQVTKLRRIPPPSLAPGTEVEVDYLQSDSAPFDAKAVKVIAIYNDVFGNLYESCLTTSEEKGAWLDWCKTR
jgi:hypothetical protein